MIAILAGIAGISFGLFFLWSAHPSRNEGSLALLILGGWFFLLVGVYALWTVWSDGLGAARAFIHGT